MLTPEVEVRVATEQDRGRVVETVVAAFEAEPAFRYFLPDDASYAAQAPVIVGHLFDGRVGLGTVWVVDGGSAVSMWNLPNTSTAELTGGITTGALDRIHRYDALVHAILPPQPFWYLGVLATHPEHAGRRWGRLAMAVGLERARADRVSACLETTTERNVAIYSASGWRVHASAPVGTFEVRVMVHPGARE